MHPGEGFLLAVLGGILMGSFSLPMKKTARWAWENTWLVWAFTALVVVPWGIACFTVPDLYSVYERSGTGPLVMVFLFGIGWGLGAVTFGQSISILGMSLAFAISIGLTLALGALVPMAKSPDDFLTASGAVITAGVALMLVGVVVSAIAGSLKEKQLRQVAREAGEEAQGAAAGVPPGLFAKGLTLCILSGLFNPMLNFASSFGDAIRKAAKEAGAGDGGASDAIWAVTLLGGFVSNAVYCALLLTRKKTWSGYAGSRTADHWILAMVMGVTWVASIAIYGRAVGFMGKLGNSAGWAITMGCCIAASNAWGMALGEWRQGKGKPLRTMLIGLAVILLAIGVIGFGNWLGQESGPA
jgi:L-rhamnose-H+ transport protein